MNHPSRTATLLALASLATLSILAPRSAVAEPEAGGEASPQAEILHLRISGMQSEACELLAEGRVLDALATAEPELYADVRADHTSGWIRIRLERPAKPESEPIDPEIETALQGAFEGACEFEFVTLQRRAPQHATDRQ